MKALLRTCYGLILALACCAAHAMNVLDLAYDAAADELVVTVAYRGTHADHRFTVTWEACRTLGDDRQEIFGLLHDSDPNDPAKTEFTRTERISLKDLACRPAAVTIGSANPLLRRTVNVPAPPR